MSMIINTSNYPKGLWPGVKKWWGTTYKMYDEGAEWRVIFESEQSDKNYEEEVGTVGMGVARALSDGDALQYDTMKQGYLTRYTHVTYATGIIVTQNEIEDLLYPKLSIARTTEMALAVKRAEEIVAANILNRAFDPLYTYGDGVPLISNSHPLDTGATYSNTLDYGADLSENALESVCTAIAGLTDMRGNLIALRPERLIVPRQLKFQAARLLDNPNRPETANRDINILNKQDLFPKGHFVYHYLQLPTSWFVQTESLDGLKRYNRISPTIAQDNDFDTYNAKFKVRTRFSVGATDPGRAIFGVQGAV